MTLESLHTGIFEPVTSMDLLPPPYLLLLVAVVVFVLVKIVKIFSYPEIPKTYFYLKGENSNIQDLVRECPSLGVIYKPPTIWGRNGHFQTATYGLLGHTSLKRTADKRHFVSLDDGTSTTFDVFEPVIEHANGDFTLVLCPGIANSSESNYIRTCVHNAQMKGWRCAVLNHLGALRDVQLTAHRIFTYGGTQEFEAMVERILELYPTTRCVIVGFSMGANIVTKYLGEQENKISSRIIAGVSVGQGYDAPRSIPVMHQWEGLRRLYMYIMTENMKHLLRRNYNMAVQPHVKSSLIDEQGLWSATSLLYFDEFYSRRIAGFQHVDDYYRWCSSIFYVDKIRVPMIFLNAADDPLVPETLYKPIRDFSEQTADTLFILTKHGGHLGFLEGHSFAPNSVTFMDKLIIEMAEAAVKIYGEQRSTGKLIERVRPPWMPERSISSQQASSSSST